MGELILIALIVLVTIGFVLLFRYENKAKREKIEWFKKLGSRLNLTHQMTKSGFSKMNNLSGKINNNSVVIYEYPYGLVGEQKTINTIIKFEPNPFDFEFQFGQEGLSSNISKAFGAKDIEFGNVKFDKAFVLKSNNESRFRSLMDLRMQEALFDSRPFMAGFIISTGTSFEYNVSGPLTKQSRREDYERIIEFMLSLIENKS